jgi:hypothetical protein
MSTKRAVPQKPGLNWVAESIGWTLVVFCTYLITLRQGLGGGDSGELTLAAATLGVVHPPGYPLYTLLGWVFSRLPVGELAWRLNLLSAFCGALGSGLVFASLRRWTGQPAPAILGAGLLAFAPLVWGYATVAEVFSLHLMFVAWAIYASVELGVAPSAGACYRAALGLGLGLGHHQTFLFYAIPWMMWALPRLRRLLPDARRRGLALGCGLLGFVPYLFLWAAAARQPAIAWGHADSLQGLWRHICRSDYGTFVLSRGDTAGEGDFLLRLGDVLRQLPAELGWPGVALLIWGGLDGLKRRRGPALPASGQGLGRLWGGACLFYLLGFTALNNMRRDGALALAMQARFAQQTYVVLAVGCAFGLLAVQRRGGTAALGPRSAKLSLGVAGLWVLLHAGLHAPSAAVTRGHLLEDWGRRVLDAAPAHSLLLCSGDDVQGSLRYLQHAQGRRPDVAVIDVAQLSYPWSVRWAARHMPAVVAGVGPRPWGFDLQQVVQVNLGRRPVLLWNARQALPAGIALLPFGPARLVQPPGGSVDLTALRRANAAIFGFDLPAAAAAYPNDSWEAHAAEEYNQSQQFYGSSLLRLAQASAVGLAGENLAAGIAALEQVAARLPEPPAEICKNLGVAYQLRSASDPAYLPRMVRSWRAYLRRCAGQCPPQETQAIQHILRRIDHVG